MPSPRTAGWGLRSSMAASRSPAVSPSRSSGVRAVKPSVASRSQTRWPCSARAGSVITITAGPAPMSGVARYPLVDPTAMVSPMVGEVPSRTVQRTVAFSATLGLRFQTVTLTTTRNPADEILHVLLATEPGRQDPYLLYRALRDIAPLFRSELDGYWYASRYDDCKAILVDPRAGRGPGMVV